jgi:hypothetical protein
MMRAFDGNVLGANRACPSFVYTAETEPEA